MAQNGPLETYKSQTEVYDELAKDRKYKRIFSAGICGKFRVIRGFNYV